MPSRIRRIAVFGSTGSIGTNTLAVVRALAEDLQIVALAACRSTAAALEQAIEFRPRWLIIQDKAAATAQDWSTLPRETELLVGDDALTRIAAHPEIDCVVAAIVGSAGLASTWSAIEAGKRVALANKETLVMAGALVMDLAAKSGAEIIPVDSEHSAIFRPCKLVPARRSNGSSSRRAAGRFARCRSKNSPASPRRRPCAIRSGRWERRSPSTRQR